MNLQAGQAVFGGAADEYRYTLLRHLDPLARGTVNVIMLNPSTADANRDDPTLRRCIKFATRWGYARLVVTNLYAYRATDPIVLRHLLQDAIGPANDEHLVREAKAAQLVVAAWGAGAEAGRVTWVRFLLADQGAGKLYCLGRTADGHPRHPLYVRARTPLEAL